jgi:hypothetical protein
MNDTTNTDIVADQLKIKAGKVTESSSSIDDSVISSKTADSKAPKKPALTLVADGVIGSGKADLSKKEKPASAKKEEDKVALFSTKNVFWDGYGHLNRGYNIVSKTKAEVWLTRSHVRLATPEEVANAFGK